MIRDVLRRRRRGSALIWVMVIGLVLVVLLATGLSMTAYSNNQAATSHTRDQAYYTALSTTETFEKWIESQGSASTSQADKDRIAAFVDSIPTSSATLKAAGLDIQLTAEQLPANTGSCIVNFKFTDEANRELKITSTAVYQGSTETVSVTMTKGAGGLAQDELAPSLEGGEFDMSEFTDYEAELNALIPDTSPVQLAYNYNTSYATDKALVDTIAAGSQDEALFQFNNTTYAEVHGTANWPLPGHSGSNDKMQFLVPANGRMTLNPLKNGNSATSSAPSNSASANANTRVSSFSVADTDGLDIKIRLGGNSMPGGASNGNYFNALITMDFTGTPGTESNEYINYYPNNTYTATPQQSYHPINWKSGTIFTQNTTDATINSGLKTRLVFGGFLHKYDNYVDYWGWGNYTMDRWYGQEKRDYFKSNSSLYAYEADNRLGMPYFPLYYNDFNLYLLDKNNNANAMLMQGLNVIDGTIYSYRGVTFGTGLVKSSTTDGPMTNLVSSNIDGYDYGGITYGNYWMHTLRWDQLIYNTDIILKAYTDSSSTIQAVYSYIRTPNKAADTTQPIDADTKKFAPTEKIVGGTIYIGTGHTLTIERGVTVQPEKVIVDGGVLIIRRSNAGDAYNLEAPVYVRNKGTIVLESGANIKADISVYDGGTLLVATTVTWAGGALLPGPPTYNITAAGMQAINVTPYTANGGIFIYGPKSKDAAGNLVGEGHFYNLRKDGCFKNIILTDAKVHMLGGAFYNDIQLTGTGSYLNKWWETGADQLDDSAIGKVLCENRYLAPDTSSLYAKFDNPAYNDCLDVGAEIGEASSWTGGAYADG